MLGTGRGASSILFIVGFGLIVYLPIVCFWTAGTQSVSARTGDALDRAGLVQTFGDEFDAFSWNSEHAPEVPIEVGTWVTNYHLGAPYAQGSRSFNGELVPPSGSYDSALREGTKVV